MEPETRYTTIGAVVLALVVAATLSFVWLSNSGRASDFRFYTVYFERQSLEGLQVGGDVNMRGVKVGRVESYTIARDNINRVRVRIRVAQSTPVSENTVAVVARNLVTGIARINLETPGTPGPELVQVAQGETDPVIPEGTSNLDQIADAVSRLAVSADKALENFNRVLGDENRVLLTETLASIRDLSAGLGKRLERIDQTAAGIERAAIAFQDSSRSIAGSVERVAERIEPLARDAGTTMRDAGAALREATGTLREAGSVMRDAGGTIREAGGTIREAGVTAREAQVALREFTQATRSLERNLSEATRALERNLSKALRNVEQEAVRVVRRTDEAVDVGVHELRATGEELRTSIELITRTLDRLQDPKAVLVGPSERQLGPGERGR